MKRITDTLSGISKKINLLESKITMLLVEREQMKRDFQVLKNKESVTNLEIREFKLKYDQVIVQRKQYEGERLQLLNKINDLAKKEIRLAGNKTESNLSHI